MATACINHIPTELRLPGHICMLLEPCGVLGHAIPHVVSTSCGHPATGTAAKEWTRMHGANHYTTITQASYKQQQSLE